MSSNLTRSVLLVAIVGFVAIGMLAVPAAATDHVDELAGDGTDAIDYEAADDQYITYTLDANGADFDEDGTETVLLNVSYEDHEHFLYEEDVDGAEADYEFNISHDELETIPGDANSTTTVEVSAWGEDAEGDETDTSSSFDLDLDFTDAHAVIFVDEDGDLIDDFDSEEIEPRFGMGILDTVSFGTFGAADSTFINTYEHEVGVAGNDTTVVIHDHSAEGADAFEEAVGERDDEDVVLGMTAAADGTPVFVFYEEANMDIVDDDDTYAIYDDGQITIEIGDDFDDEEIDILAASENPLDADMDVSDVRDLASEVTVSELRSAFGTFDTVWHLRSFPVGLSDIPFVGVIAPLFAIGVVVTRRRRWAA